MRIAILSGGGGWHVADLIRAATELGHDASSLDFRALSASVGGGTELLDGFDGVILRTMPFGSLEQVVFRMDLLHELAARGVRVLNPPRAIETCVDKYLTTAKLARAAIASPATHISQLASAALEGFAQLGNDVVIKPMFGSEGRGMVRLGDRETAWRVFHALERTGQVIYQQQFIQHPGWDFRAFVIDDRVVASMKRIGQGDWRTNVAQGGIAEAVSLDESDCNLAIRAARVVGCPVAGVDLLPGPEGKRFVIEVNAVPGWRTLAPVSGVDIAREVVGYLSRL